MATTAPVAPAAAPSAPTAPASPAPHLSPNEQIAAALTDAGAPPAPPASVAVPAEQQPGGGDSGQGDPLEAVLAGLPQDHPAWARLQSLRTVEGRHRQTAAEAARAGEMERIAEGLAVEAVLAGADPRAIGARYGIDPQALIEATGWQPGGPGQAGGAEVAPGQQHPLARGAEQAPGHADLQPLNFAELYYRTMVQGADPSAEGSWSKPYFDAMDRAAALRESADMAMAEAYSIEDPAQKGIKTRTAETARAQAREAERAAMMQLEERRASMNMRAYKNLDARLQQFERAVAEAREAESQKEAGLQAWANVGSQLRAARLEDGSAEFGPNGYGIFEVDAAGNCTNQTTAQGDKALRLAREVMVERQWPPTMQSLRDALDLIVVNLYASGSDDGGTPAAGAAAGGGGDITLPASGGSPGGGNIRPSVQAQPNPAEQRMF